MIGIYLSGEDKSMYFAKDHLGTVRTTMNETGEIENATDYYPYGEEITGRSVNCGQLAKYKFTGKERDTETSYDYFGARYYDSRLGRWLQVDPMSEKYPGWSGYNYTLNNPLIFIDTKGDTVSVITSGPAINQIFRGEINSNSLIGHTAINVDGTVYSFEGNGKWSLYTYNDYMNNETSNRTMIEQTVDVDQNKIQNALDNRTDGAYNPKTNSCVTNSMTVLGAGGIPFNKPNGAVTPEQLSNALQGSKYVTNASRTPSINKSSLGGMLFYKLLGFFVNEGMNPTGVQPNTAPLIKKEDEKKEGEVYQ